MYNSNFWRHQPPLSHPAEDDSYLFEDDEEEDREPFHWPDQEDRCDPGLE